MNRNKLKTYAPEARRDFIEAVTARAAQYGLTAKKIESMTVEGDVAMIAGKPYSKAVGEKRKKLEARISRDGFEQTMEAMAYTWFNRLVAIRYMELHEYLDHGYRVLSHPQGHSLPEIVEHAEHVDLPGLDKKKVIELKLDGTKEEELYRLLLIGQCNALSKAMPFLFESIDDETELLLPDHLLHSDSLIRNLVNEIPEEDWQEVEIIGWLYQFYISEKKDEVIGKVVKSEDIPAATQLFTPNWIVKYLVQNSLGRQWMATYPDSPLKEQMKYYIEPAEQTQEVQAQLAEITPESLNPEELTLLDPACGSGHILVEAYDLLKAIYQERGYRAKDIPRLILEKNLYGLEIDDRAAQLAAFALMMKARADDRNIFERDAQPHVLSIQESKGLDAAEITEALNAPLPDGSTGDISKIDVAHLIELFEEGKTFGSLIQVPAPLAGRLPAIAQRTGDVLSNGGLFDKSAARALESLIKQTSLLHQRFHFVVANPPYMGRKFLAPKLKALVDDQYPDFNKDLYTAFIARCKLLSHRNGVLGFMSPFTWMFISSHESFREYLIRDSTFTSFVQLEYSGFAEATVPVCVFTFYSNHIDGHASCFIRLSDFRGAENQGPRTLEAIRNRNCGWFYVSRPDEFSQIPGSPIAYWVSKEFRDAFTMGIALKEVAEPRLGMATGDNDRYVRLWQEVSIQRIGFDYSSRQAAKESKRKWFPYNKGGEFRRWYGNNDCVVDWENDGKRLQTRLHPSGRRIWAHNFNLDYIFKPCVTWTFVSSSFFGLRQSDSGFLFDVAGSSAFPRPRDVHFVTSFLCSNVAFMLLRAVNPTLNFQAGNVGNLPLIGLEDSAFRSAVEPISKDAVSLARADWDDAETSWNFLRCPLLVPSPSIQSSLEQYTELCKVRVHQMKQLEEENNRLFIKKYHLQGELSPEVPDAQITLYRSDQEEDIKRLISYSIGCMMGRYSLDEPGLIYAHSGNESFDPAKYTTFPADEDGIVPLTEFLWFEDDAASRFEKFVASTWPKEHLVENLEFVAESLGQKRGESSRDAIRRYLAADFFKHHLSLYKKRPIYWLFSSGKQKGFQALVYLHRYNEGTLARMRTEYVIPLLGKMTARIDHLTDDIAAASSSQHQKRLEKEKATVVKQLAEVQQFDEKLRHYADQRISLDLDDGVKENYGKFGTLLADVKAVTGNKPKD